MAKRTTPVTRARRGKKIAETSDTDLNGAEISFEDESIAEPDEPAPVSAAAERRQRLKEIRTRLRASGQEGRGR